MLTFPAPFPWWLWILSALWVGTLCLRRSLPVSSEWNRWLNGLIVVYTALVLYMSLKSTWPRDWSMGLWTWGLCAGFSSVTALGGALWSICSESSRSWRWGSGLAYFGLSGLSACLESFELAVMGVAACGLILLDSQSADHDSQSRPGRSSAVLVAIAATLMCVAWLGVVQYGLRVEGQRPGPSRWYTVIPAVEAVQRWRTMAGDALSGTAVSPTHMILAASVVIVVWLGRRHGITSEETAVGEVVS
ncbi:hypothetical protein GC163_07045 [bacterium]|nr:hypothetical protein [bacterium]